MSRRRPTYDQLLRRAQSRDSRLGYLRAIQARYLDRAGHLRACAAEDVRDGDPKGRHLNLARYWLSMAREYRLIIGALATD